MEQSFFQRHRKVFIILGVIIGIILAVTGFIAVAIVLILVIIGVKQLTGRKRIGPDYFESVEVE